MRVVFYLGLAMALILSKSVHSSIIDLQSTSSVQVDTAWLNQAMTNLDASVINWLQSEIREEKPSSSEVGSNSTSCSQGKKCTIIPQHFEEHPSIVFFASFSMPDSVWIERSKELAKVNGTFVVRGLPQNSFKAFAAKLLQLKKQGMSCPVQINPKLFVEHRIKQVPTILFSNDTNACLIAGNISLKAAQDILEQKGKAICLDNGGRSS